MGRKADRSGNGQRDIRKDMVQGAVLGGLLYAGLYALRIPKAFMEFDHSVGVAIAAGLGALLYAVRLRSLLWILSAGTVIVFAIATMTTIVPRAARGLIRRDELRRADAVLVLGSSTTKERKLDHVAFARMIDGLRLVQDGWAPRLIWTEVGGDHPSARADVAEIARLCGNPTVEAIGPVLSTRDEAMRFATLAQKRGWKSVILVTSPYHSSRAVAVFRKLGLDVISYPSTEREFAPSNPKSTRERLEVFRWWLYEQVRWFYYRARGWI